jgi:copper chaperone for superoxide dismutase
VCDNYVEGFQLVADATGRAELLMTVHASLQVWDLIGRALVVSGVQGGAVAAVLARSAVAGDNMKKVCACDGTVIWAAGDLIRRPAIM